VAGMRPSRGAGSPVGWAGILPPGNKSILIALHQGYDT